MGKHDMAAPISESLERHYQEQIKLLEKKVAKMEATISDAYAQLEVTRLRLDEKEAYIDELRTALVQQTILASARK